MENLTKKNYTKTLFASNFVLVMVVSERVLERQYQGLNWWKVCYERLVVLQQPDS